MKQLFTILAHKATQYIMYCALTGNVLACIDFTVKFYCKELLFNLDNILHCTKCTYKLAFLIRIYKINTGMLVTLNSLRRAHVHTFTVLYSANSMRKTQYKNPLTRTFLETLRNPCIETLPWESLTRKDLCKSSSSFS